MFNEEDSQARIKSKVIIDLHTSLLVAVFLYLVSLIKTTSAPVKSPLAVKPNNLRQWFFHDFFYAMSGQLIHPLNTGVQFFFGQANFLS